MRKKLISCIGMLPVVLNYFTSAFAADQKTVSGTLSDDVVYVVTNNKEAVIPTGISIGVIPIIIISIAAAAVFLATKKRADASTTHSEAIATEWACE